MVGYSFSRGGRGSGFHKRHHQYYLAAYNRLLLYFTGYELHQPGAVSLHAELILYRMFFSVGSPAAGADYIPAASGAPQIREIIVSTRFLNKCFRCTQSLFSRIFGALAS